MSFSCDDLPSSIYFPFSIFPFHWKHALEQEDIRSFDGAVEYCLLVCTGITSWFSFFFYYYKNIIISEDYNEKLRTYIDEILQWNTIKINVENTRVNGTIIRRK